MKVKSLSLSVDCSLPGSSVYGILKARVLEWVAIAFSMTGTEDVLKVEVPPLKHVQGKHVTISLD